MKWRRRKQFEADMREEMEFHIEARAETLIGRGMPREQAERTARLEFGSVDARREECRDEAGYRPWDELKSDLQFAMRAVAKRQGYAAAVVLILALAIGVNSTFFTVYSQYVLKPLAIDRADRHFDLEGRDANGRSTGSWTRTEIEALQQVDSRIVEGSYASRTIQVLVLEPVQRPSVVSFVSGNYFRLLRAKAAAGRTLSEGEEDEPVIVLSRSGQRRPNCVFFFLIIVIIVIISGAEIHTRGNSQVTAAVTAAVTATGCVVVEPRHVRACFDCIHSQTGHQQQQQQQ